MLKVKILVVGPCESGKTIISNFLSEQSENNAGDYRPTQGVRILEFETGQVKVKGRTGPVDVELWDCSGDTKYEGCWAAMAKDTNGIVFVFNPDQSNQDTDLENWHTFITNTSRLRDSQCLLMTKTQRDIADVKDRLPPVFSKIPHVRSNLEDDPESFRSEFSKFISTVATSISEKNDQEELSIMNNR